MKEIGINGYEFGTIVPIDGEIQLQKKFLRE